LYKEVGSLKIRDVMEREAEELKTMEYFTGKRDFGKYMPVPTKKAANKEGFGKNTEVSLVEWEKN